MLILPGVFIYPCPKNAFELWKFVSYAKHQFEHLGFVLTIGNPVISWDGIDATTAVVWEISRDGGRAVVVAYNASTLRVLYDTEQNPARDRAGGYVKFGVPIVVRSGVVSTQLEHTTLSCYLFEWGTSSVVGSQINIFIFNPSSCVFLPYNSVWSFATPFFKCGMRLNSDHITLNRLDTFFCRSSIFIGMCPSYLQHCPCLGCHGCVSALLSAS
jgi:hypothetical protein